MEVKSFMGHRIYKGYIDAVLIVLKMLNLTLIPVNT